MKHQKFPSHEPFKKGAREHMRKWIKSTLRENLIESKSVILPLSDARAGKNFYGEAIPAVSNRFPNTFKAKTFGRVSLAGNALRSASAVFNLFAPLQKYLGSKEKEIAILVSQMIGVKIIKVKSIKFEQPAKTKNKPLNDRTALDVLITAVGKSGEIGIGIEVKYTEGPYSWGKLERKRMNDPKEIYAVKIRKSGMIDSNNLSGLNTRHLKQIWRNVLLGEAMFKNNFYYVHLFPEGNTYQAAVAQAFEDKLTKLGRSRFKQLTYESYIKFIEDIISQNKWTKYLRNRYLIK